MPIEWSAEEEVEYKAAAKRVIEHYFGGYKKKIEPVVESEPVKAKPDPEPLPVTPKVTSKEPRYESALGVSYGMNSKGRKSHRPTITEAQNGSATVE